MTVGDLLVTLNSDIRIIVYEDIGKLFDSYLFETRWDSLVWGYYMHREVKLIGMSDTQTNVLTITLCKEEKKDE